MNLDLLKKHLCQYMLDTVRRVDKKVQACWSTSIGPSVGDYKSGGTGIVSFGKAATRVKQSGTDRMGRWSYQLLSG